MAEIKYVGNDAITEVISKTKSALSGKVDKADGKGLSTNDYTTDEKNKLAGIATGAQVNVIETIKLKKDSNAATALTPSSKAVTIDVSDKVTAAQVKAYNDLTNYYTKSNTYTKEEVNSLVGGLKTIQFSIVEELPATGQSNVIYLVAHAHSDDTNVASGQSNAYDEYIWLSASSKFEKIGTTDIDMTNYVGRSGSQNMTIPADGSVEYDWKWKKGDFTCLDINFGQFGSADITLYATNQLGGSVTDYVVLNPSGFVAKGKSVVRWADVATKDYVTNYLQLNYVPNTTTVNGHALSSNVTVTASDVGAVPTSRKVNGKALSSDITLGLSDIDTDAATKTWVGQQGFAKTANLDTHTAMTATEIDTIWAAA